MMVQWKPWSHVGLHFSGRKYNKEKCHRDITDVISRQTKRYITAASFSHLLPYYNWGLSPGFAPRTQDPWGGHENRCVLVHGVPFLVHISTQNAYIYSS